jgi:hypothetical protein
MKLHSSGPTNPKLRRSTSPPGGDHGIHGSTNGTSTSTCTLRMPLLTHNTSGGTKATMPKRNLLLWTVGAATLLLVLLLSPWIYWLLLYFREPLRDESCLVPEWKFPDCSAHILHTTISPLVTPQQLLDFRRQYHESGVQESSMTSDWANLTKIVNGQVVDNTGFLLPVQFQYAPGKGRGIYATHSIAKGEQIWDSRFRAVFDTECSTRTFLSKLSEEDQCKIMFWGYSNNFYGNGFQFMVDFDGHGYMNHCDAASPARNTAHYFEGELDTPYSTLPHIFAYTWSSGNVDQTTLRKRTYPGAHGMYATRDIEAGEELCFDYSEIHENVHFDYYTKFWTHSLQVIHWWNL